MQNIEVRFWDVKGKQMIYGAGLAPTGQPIFKVEPTGFLEEQKGKFVPMLNTFQKDTKKENLWEGDIVQCDVPISLGKDMPATHIRKHGVMQYNPNNGTFIINIQVKKPVKGQVFGIVNAEKIGDIYTTPELLTANPNLNEKPKAKSAKRT